MDEPQKNYPSPSIFEILPLARGVRAGFCILLRIELASNNGFVLN